MTQLLDGTKLTGFPFRISQEVVNNTAYKIIDGMYRAGVPDEDVQQIKMEVEGGNCPWCGEPWVPRHASGDVKDIVDGKVVINYAVLGEFDYYIPACYCLKKFQQERNMTQTKFSYLHDRMAEAKIPKSEWDVDWSNWDYSVDDRLTESMKSVKTWSDEAKWRGGRGLILCGAVGTGKTRCSLMIAKDILDRYPKTQLRFLPMADLLDAIIRDQGEKGYIEALLSNDVILVDDLDKIAAEKEWARTQVFSFYDSAIRSGISIIGTTNLSGPAEMTEKFEYAIVSRIVGACDFVKFEGTRQNDYRIIRKRYAK